MATKQKDLKCIQGIYYETDTAGDKVNYRFQAEKIIWIPVMGTDSGGYSTVSNATTPAVNQFSVADGTEFSANNIVIVGLDTGDEPKIVQSVSTNLITLTTNLSAAPEVGDDIKAATCKTYVQRVSDSKYAYADSDGKTQYTLTLATAIQYHSLRYDWKDYEIGLDEDLRCYLDGIDPTIAENPCEVEIITGLTRDQHIVVIERLTDNEAGATNYLRHNCFFLYDEDDSYPREWFKTGSSTTVGTIQALPSIKEGGQDLRNSFTVIGSRIMTEVAGSIQNPNNPTNRYVSSKSVDVESVLKASAANFIGRERKAVIIHNSINSQGRADFISLKSLRKFRTPKAITSFRSLGNPLIEFGDCVSIEDQEKLTVQKTQKNWIESIHTTSEKENYKIDFEATPYKPEQSYSPMLNVDLTEYNPPGDNYPVVNVEITCGGRREQGNGYWGWDPVNEVWTLYDVSKHWQTDEWVNDGWGNADGFEIYDYNWNRLIIQSNTATSVTASLVAGEDSPPGDVTLRKYYIISREGRHADHPYDPYWSDESSKYINIKFDLLVSAWVDIQVRAENGDIIVANLLNPSGSGENYEKLIPGTYKIHVWDGIDQYGVWNQRCGIQETRVYEDNSIETTIGKGFFVAEGIYEGAREDYSKFYLLFSVKGENDVFYDPPVRSRTLEDDNSANNPLGNQWIYIKRGDPITGSLTIDPVFTQPGTDVLEPTTFWNDGHDGKGLKITYQTSSPHRYAQKELKIIPYIYHRYLSSSGNEFQGWLREGYEGKAIWNPVFDDYSSGRTMYFKPADKPFDYIYDSPTLRQQAKYETNEKLTIVWSKAAWAFGFELRLTDKSGRSTVDRKYIAYRHRSYTAAAEVARWLEVHGLPYVAWTDSPADNWVSAGDLGYVWMVQVFP